MLDIKAIKERVAKLDEDEWQLSYTNIATLSHIATDKVIVQRDYKDARHEYFSRPIEWLDADLVFIMHARRDVPELIAEVERLRESRKKTAELGIALIKLFGEEIHEAELRGLSYAKLERTKSS